MPYRSTLRSNKAKNDVLPQREVPKGLQPTCALGIILKLWMKNAYWTSAPLLSYSFGTHIKHIYIQFHQEVLRDAIIAAFREVHALCRAWSARDLDTRQNTTRANLHVPAASMHRNDEVCRPVRCDLIVDADVRIQQSLPIHTRGLHPGNQHIRAVKGKSGIIKLNAPAASVVQVVDFLAEDFDKVREILGCDGELIRVRQWFVDVRRPPYHHSCRLRGRRYAPSHAVNASTLANTL